MFRSDKTSYAYASTILCLCLCDNVLWYAYYFLILKRAATRYTTIHIHLTRASDARAVLLSGNVAGQDGRATQFGCAGGNTAPRAPRAPRTRTCDL